MNNLVTGCAGFIGWKVSELLLAQGHRVFGVDNLNDAYDVRIKEWRLKTIQDHPNFTFHRLDICNRGRLRQLFNSKLDAVFNLAARAGVRQSVEDPWIYYDSNVTGTLNLLELCRGFGVKKFILASTSSLYGAKNPRPFREDADTDGPLSPYAASKKAAEALCYTYHYLYDLDIIVLRYFTVYGPAGRPDMSIFRFIQWISEEQPVLVYGDGQQSRDFTFVDDIARGTIGALNFLQSEIRNSKFEIINLGSDHPIVLNDVIQMVEKLVGKRARIEYQPCHPADVMATWADNKKAERLLNWRPETPFEEGLKQAISWYQKEREWASKVKTR